MKKIILSYIFILNLIFPNNWVEYNKELISSTSLVIMFQDNLSPRLGAEPPIILSDFSKAYS